MPGAEEQSIAGEIADAERRIGAAEARLEAGRAARTAVERELRDEVARLRTEFETAREQVVREVGALNQRSDRNQSDIGAAVAGREQAVTEAERVAAALAALESWREAVDRDRGRLTAELAQRSAAIDDVMAAIDTLGLQEDRAVEIEASLASLRREQTELRAETDERELRTEAAEGRLSAIETSAESFSGRMHALEAGAEASTEEVRRLAELRARLDALEHQASHTAAALRRVPAPAAAPAAGDTLRSALRSTPTRRTRRGGLAARLRAVAVALAERSAGHD